MKNNTVARAKPYPCENILAEQAMVGAMKGQSIDEIARHLGISRLLAMRVMQSRDVEWRLDRLHQAVQSARKVPVAPWLPAWTAMARKAAAAFLPPGGRRVGVARLARG